MTPADHHDAGYEHNEDVAHEHSDINIRTVLLSAAALAGATAVVFVVVLGVFKVLAHQAAGSDPQLSPLAIPAGQLPAEPRLQTNEYAGLKTFRESEAATLEGYGWVDQKAGVARLPIDQAKKRLLERGIASRQGVPVSPTLGTAAPAYGESSSGRLITRPLPAPGTAPEPQPAPAHKGGN